MVKIWNLILVALLLGACSNEEEQVTLTEVYSIRDVGTLSTTEYTLGKVLHWNDEGEWYKFGDRRILISCKATVRAGINLNEMKDADFVVSGKRIEIYMPAPEVVSFDMKPEDVHTEVVDVNGFRENFSQDEKMKVLKKGEAAIRKDMEKLHILDEAERNAKAFLQDFYTNQGFKEVIIHEAGKDKRNKNLDR